VVLTSEGERDAKINQAEGEKQRVIKESEASQQQQINEAQGRPSHSRRGHGHRRRPASRRRSPERSRHEAMQLRVAEEYVSSSVRWPAKRRAP
jgi:regulator of protease activity HflC (stomatin/prohibitin superfamily)